MTEQQKAAIEEAAKEYVNRQPFSEHMTKGDFNMKVFEVSNIMQEVINSPYRFGLQPVNQWISCKDRFPEIYGSVIIYGKYTNDCPMSVYEAVFDQKKKIFYSEGIKSKNVTHWQPLPQPPINEREEGYEEGNNNHVEVGFRNNIYKRILNRGRTKGNE